MSGHRFPPNLILGLRRLAARSHDLLFPPQCAGCDAHGHHLCPRCVQEVQAAVPRPCPRCKQPPPVPGGPCPACESGNLQPLLLMRSAARHAGPMRAAIHRYKYENQPELAVPLTRYLLAAFAGDEWAAAREAIDVVIPVPLHPDRFAERGYNQSELLAAEFCRHTKISMQPDWIVRTRQTRPQVGLTATERTENVQSAFVAGPWSAERNILLIDDVFTTGATMQACAMAAKNVGANAVFGLTLAMPMA